MQTDEKTVSTGEEMPEVLANDEQAELEEWKGIHILRMALAESKRSISVAWVQRKFDYGYSKSSYLLRCLAQEGYIESEEDMKEAGRKTRRILVPKDFFEKKD